MEKDAVLARLKIGEPLLWTNAERQPVDSVLPELPLQYEDILAPVSRGRFSSASQPPAEFSSLVARGSRAAPAFPDSIAARR